MNKHWMNNRNNYKVHQTVESYLEWFEKAYPEKKKANKYRNRKTSDNKDYVLIIEHKEVILTFD